MSPARRAGLPYRRGVGAALFNDRGLVLVARRIDTVGDAWQLPQGGIKNGEAPSAAVLRELAEEIGTDRFACVAEAAAWRRYDLPDDLVGRVWNGRWRGQEQLWFALRFTGVDADIDPAAVAKPEFDAWRWVAPEALPALAIAFKRRLYEDLVAEFAPVIRSHTGPR